MDKEIKRLLKLKTIPGFKISPEEERLLDEWKKAQKPVEIKLKKTYKKKKTTNEVKEESKETGKIEVENTTPEIEIVNVTTFWETES